MKVLGIVSEYNPFHNGHKYQIEKSKGDLNISHTVAVMSGNFVMRGEIAVFDKFTRAKSAVLNGVDLVIELPVVYALSSAEFFAKGSISILNSLNIIDYLSFGSEAGDVLLLERIADEIIKPETQIKIKKYIKEGIPIFKAIERSVNIDYKEILNKPNNILGINYLKALKQLNSNITPYTLKRKNAEHDGDEIKGGFASAMAIRNLIKRNESYAEYVPESAYEVYKESTPVFEEYINQAICYALRVKDRSEFINHADVSEGLHNLIKEAAYKHYDINDIIAHIKSKRYSHTRIRRIIYNIFLDINKDLRHKTPEYARVLAFNDKGRELLSILKNKSSIPLITNVTKKMFLKYDMLSCDFKASQLYRLACSDKVSRGDFICERL